MRPGFAQIEFNAGNADKKHHCPPSDAIERLHNGRIENEFVIIGIDAAENAGAKQNTSDDLNDDEWCVIVSFADPPDQIGYGEDDRHCDQENFGGVHYLRVSGYRLSVWFGADFIPIK